MHNVTSHGGASLIICVIFFKVFLLIFQVIDWLNITVDAHFAQLVLSIEARKLLVDLHQTVESQVRFLNILTSE